MWESLCLYLLGLMQNSSKYFISILTLLLIGCSNFPDEPWNDEYFVKSALDGHHELDCSNEKAEIVAAQAIKAKYPKHYHQFLKKGFSIYSAPYGDYKGEDYVKRYVYKSILGYKEIEHMKYGGSYYEKHIEVSLSQECEVLGVDYFKGKIEYLY